MSPEKNIANQQESHFLTPNIRASIEHNVFYANPSHCNSHPAEKIQTKFLYPA